MHWIHRDENTLDYFAYRYHRDGGGARFRRAVNRREVGGLLIQDFENFRADQEPVADIAEFGRLHDDRAVHARPSGALQEGSTLGKSRVA